MPRPNRGPQLVQIKKRDHAEAYWYVRWYESGKKCERTTGVPCSQPAPEEALVDHFERQSARPGSPRDPARFLISDALTLYADEHAPNTTDPERISYCIDALLPFWGELYVDAVKGTSCRRYAAQRYRLHPETKTRTKIGDGTIRRELGCLNAALRYCVKEGYLIHAPPVTTPPKPAAKDVWITRKQAGALIRAARNEPKSKHHLPLFILIGLYTGAREGAILSLRWTQNTDGGWVDLENERIDFNPVGRVQTKKRRAVIPIPNRLMRFLLAAYEKGETDYVIEYRGKPIKAIRKAFAGAASTAGIVEATEHTLRHTCATWMSQRGVDKSQAADWLEMTVETYEKVYRKHDPDYMEEARRAFD